MSGASLLFLTNLVAIVASAFAVFLLVGMNSPDIREQMQTSRSHEWFAEQLKNGKLSGWLRNGGQLRWRVLMLAILLGAVSVPLRTALLQVASEALARGTVQDVVHDLVPRGALVSQQVEVGKDNIAVELISTRDVPADRTRQAEREIERRSGRKSEVSVATVASQSELTQLMQKIAAPPLLPQKPAEKTLDEIQHDLIGRVKPVIFTLWPPEAPLQDFDLTFSPTGVVVNARYQSKEDLGQIPVNMLTQQLRDKLATPALALNVQRISPPAQPVPSRKPKGS